MIAHASIDENGNISGGTAGDQSEKEVCIRSFYTNNWDTTIDIENDMIRIAFGNNMIDCANNNNIGYNQNRRNSLLTVAESVNFVFSKITKACDCDCSSLVTIALLGAIYQVLGKESYEIAKSVMVEEGNCATTRTLVTRMKKLMITIKTHTSTTYTASKSKAVFGTIYLRTGKHVVVYVESGTKVGEVVQNSDPHYYPQYNGASGSIVMGLIALGVDSSVAHRYLIAEANGITDYNGTAKQNLTLLRLLREGKLKKPQDEVENYYPKYEGDSCSIVDALLAVGATDDGVTFSARKKIAMANGITDYTATSKQNLKLLNLLKEGKLKRED